MKHILLLLICLSSIFAFGQSGGPTYPIGLLRGNNSFEGGSADSVNVRCKIRGVVYGNNFRASSNGLTFSLRDASGWIGLFKDNSDFGLGLQEGDSIRAIGIINAFNGLSQMTLDSVKLISRNRPLVAPVVVTTLNESTESKLVKLEGWQWVNPSQWTPGAGSGFTVQAFKGTDTLDIRIDNDCPWFNQPAPTGILDIIGLGGQFDPSVPRNSGYQLLPRRLSDIYAQGSLLQARFPNGFGSVAEGSGSIQIPVNLNIASSAPVAVQIFVKSASATSGQDYSFLSPTVLNFGPFQTENSFPVTIINNLVPELPESITFVIRPGNGFSGTLIGADSLFTLTISDDDGGGNLIPTYQIGTVRGNNSAGGGGLPDSLQVYAKLRGVVYGSNLLALQNGFLFTLRDQTSGIGIRSSIPLVSNLNEGDSVIVIGRIGHQNGLAMVLVDSMRRFATGRPLKTPTVVNQVNEGTESDLIKVQGFQLVNPAEWTTGVGINGFSARIFKGTDTLLMRVSSSLALYNEPPPTGLFNLTGLGWQSDPFAPFTTGYQIMPRGGIDLQLLSGNPTIRFAQNGVPANEGAGTLIIPISLNSAPANLVGARVVVKGGTALVGQDFILSSNPNVQISSGTTSVAFNVTLIDDASQESDETIILVLRQPNGCTIGSDSIFTITITDNDQPGAFIPTYPIGLLRGNNSIEGGVADSLGVLCKVNGKLYGINLRGVNNGIQFAIRDATGGINIFRSSSNFGLNLQEGDSVRAIGRVNQFNGLSQINVDSVVVLATGRPLSEPLLVDSLSENTESNLVRLSGFSIVNPAQWTTGTGTGFTVQISNGVRTIDMRIDNDCELFNLPVPNGFIISITGIGGQFDGSIPRNQGYQLLPRRSADIETEVSTKAPEGKNPFVWYPNPGQGNVRLMVPIEMEDKNLSIKVVSPNGKTLMEMEGKAGEISSAISEILPNQANGLYLFRMSLEGKTWNNRWIKL